MNESLSINKNIQSGSRNLFSLPGMSSTSCTAMAHRTHSRSGRQHPSGILGVYDWSGV